MMKLCSFKIICHNALKSLSKLTSIIMKATIVYSDFMFCDYSIYFCLTRISKSQCCDCSSFYNSNIILVRCYTQKLKQRHTQCGHFSFSLKFFYCETIFYYQNDIWVMAFKFLATAMVFLCSLTSTNSIIYTLTFYFDFINHFQS